MLALTRQMVADLPKNGETDPIEYYRRPLVGALFRRRINLGLALLPPRRFGRALEVGYGAGAVQLALAPAVDELFGIDLDADPEPVARRLAAKGIAAKLAKGSVYRLPFLDATFDLVVSFSVFEHLRAYEQALFETRRVLRPRGLLLLGMPAVNRMMQAGFRAIGFEGIEDHHVTTPSMVAARFEDVGLRVVAKATLDVPAPRPFGMTLYHDWLLERAPARS